MYRILSGVLFFTLSALPALSATAEHKFRLSIAGLSVANIVLEINTDGDSYEATAKVRGRGLVGSFVDLDYDGHSEGRLGPDGMPEPQFFRSVRKDDEDGGRTTMIRYSGGTPVSVSAEPPRPSRPWDIAPATQAGTLDPISTALAIIGDRAVGEACNRRIDIYDGRRLARLSLGQRERRDNFWICPGNYRRIAGYPPKRMNEQVDFPFEITYEQIDGKLRVVRIDMDSTFGSARMQRR